MGELLLIPWTSGSREMALAKALLLFRSGEVSYQEMVLYPQLPSRWSIPRGSHMGMHWGWAEVGGGENVGKCLSGGFCEKERGARVSSLRVS